MTPEKFCDRILMHAQNTVGKNQITMHDDDWYRALAYAVRDEIAPRWLASHKKRVEDDEKQVCYLSMEYLMGRSLSAHLVNLGLYDSARAAMELLKKAHCLDSDWNKVILTEPEAGLGNGGLGRLAACLLDSMASVGIPAWGYGLHYDFGMFHQHIDSTGRQSEEPDNWVRHGNPWEFTREKDIFEVQFGGEAVQFFDHTGDFRYEWINGERIVAVGRDQPVPGFGGHTVNTIRLWRAEPQFAFDLQAFNVGDYIEAVRERIESQNLSRVLYPDDSTHQGQELRLKQEYFFTCASLQDILRRFHKNHGSWALLQEKVAIQLNDTHPAIAVPELMRQLIDIHGLAWDEAWSYAVPTLSYTNHTVLPEALETWPAEMFERLLPRHWQIICEINHRFLEDVRGRYPGDHDLYRRVSIIDEEGGRRVRMAHLAFVGGHKVNGVAKVHTDLIRKGIFKDLDKVLPGRIVNKTNGVTSRRWMMLANRRLKGLLKDTIGDDWQTDLSRLRDMEPLIKKKYFRDAIGDIKQYNKSRLANMLKSRHGAIVDTERMFDIQVKRIHEYKRQLLNVLHTVTLYNRIRNGHMDHVVPRTVMFGGKAAPAYQTAKQIIWLINDIAKVVNRDPMSNDCLQVVFVPNFNVSVGQVVYPGAELSEQISTAGTEASGTGNMKFALNGALTIGTMDGANIEMAEEIGEENMFIFGLGADEANDIRFHHDQDGWAVYHEDAELRDTIDLIRDGFFSPTERDRHAGLMEALLDHDEYLLTNDYRSYVEAQERVAAAYRDTDDWNRKSALNIARMGKFSSDRTVLDYAEDIWHVTPRTTGPSKRPKRRKAA